MNNCDGCVRKSDWCLFFNNEAINYIKGCPCLECILKVNCTEICVARIQHRDLYRTGFYKSKKR
jgi:hypothetical protein